MRIHSDLIGLVITSSLVSGCEPSAAQPRALVAPDLVASPEREDAVALDRADALDRVVLVCAVLERNPDLAAAEEALAAARAASRRPVAAGATRVGFAIAPVSIGRDVPFGFIVDVEQSVRLGQRRLEREVATTGAEAYSHRRDGVRNELALAATSLYDDHFEIARALETNAEHHALVTDLVETATRRFASGLVSAQDPLQAELELARIEQERVELEAERAITAARVNRLLHRAPETPLPPPPARLDPLEREPSAGDLRKEALAARPELRAAGVEADARTRSVQLARRRFAPELSAMASYNSMWADVEHRFMLGVGLMVPLQVGALRAGVGEARAEARRAQRVVDAERDRVAAEVEEARARVSAAERILKLQRERLIPTARDRVEAARIGYESNANDIDALIDAERELRSVELEAQRAFADLDRRRAELDWAVGRVPCAKAEVRR